MQWTKICGHFYEALPAKTKELSLGFPDKFKHGMEKDFIQALSKTIDDTDSLSTLPELKSLNVYQCDFSSPSGSAAHLELMRHVDRRSQAAGFAFDLNLQLCKEIEEDERAKRTRRFMEEMIW